MNKLFSLMNFYLEPEKNHCNQMQVHNTTVQYLGFQSSQLFLFHAHIISNFIRGWFTQTDWSRVPPPQAVQMGTVAFECALPHMVKV